MIGWIVLMMLVAMALAAPRYGVDTRRVDIRGDGWGADRAPRAPHRDASPIGDALALGRWVRGHFAAG